MKSHDIETARRVAAERGEENWRNQHRKVLDLLRGWQSTFQSDDGTVKILKQELDSLIHSMKLFHPDGASTCPPLTKKLLQLSPSPRKKKTSHSTGFSDPTHEH